MSSKTSLFNRSLIRGDWRHYWPLFFIYTFIMLLSLPISVANYIGEYTNGYYDAAVTKALAAETGIYSSMGFAVGMAAVFGVLFIMAVFSYIYSGRASDLLHAMPVKRETLFVSHMASAFQMMTAGNLIAAVIGLVVALSKGAAGGGAIGALGQWLLAAECSDVFFLGFASICAQATGWLLAVPVVYLGMNVVVYAVTEVIKSTASGFYYGYAYVTPTGLEKWLTPLLQMSDVCDDFRQWSDTGNTWVCAMPDEFVPTMLIYAAAGVIICAGALVMYRARKSESAGEAVAFGFLKPVVLYVISFAGAVGLGLGVYVLFSAQSFPVLLVCQLVTGLICYFGVQMLIYKSFAVLNKNNIIGAAALCLVVCAVSGCIRADITGYQKRIPDAASVEKIKVSESVVNVYAEVTGTEAIEKCISLHECIAAQGSSETDEASVTDYINIEYTLKNGRVMCRNYAYYITPYSETHAATNALVNDIEVKQKVLESFTEETLLAAAHGSELTILTGDITYYSGIGIYGYESYDELTLSAEDTTAILEALRLDMQEQGSYDVLSGVNLCSVYFSLYASPEVYAGGYIRPDYSNTWAVLEAKDLLDRQLAYAPDDYYNVSDGIWTYDSGYAFG